MRKKEFLRELSKKLSNMNRRDREDVLAYYDELIEDKLDRTDDDEDEIIYSLGSIDRIAKRVSRSSQESKERIKADDDNGYVPGHRRRKHNRNGLMVFIATILGIIFIPVMLALGLAVGVTVFCVFIASFAVVIGGIYVGISGIVLLFSNFTLGLFECGTGLITIGVGIILAPLITKLVCLVFKCLVKVGKAICRGIGNIGGSSYEN